MERMICLICVLLALFCFTPRMLKTASAFEIGEEEISATIDFTYASKYIWQGFDVYDGNGAFQPSVTFEYRGFYVGFWGSWADESGFVELTEFDYILGYGRSFFEEERYAVDMGIAYLYYDYPKANSDIDVQEICVSLFMPNLIPLGPSSLIPGYSVCYDWSGIQSGNLMDDGWFHTLSLTYDVPIPALVPTQDEQAITLLWDATYNDGAYGTDSGLSHTRVGISTTFEWNAFYFTPAINYQWSLEDTVNPEDEFYVMSSFGFTF